MERLWSAEMGLMYTGGWALVTVTIVGHLDGIRLQQRRGAENRCAGGRRCGGGTWRGPSGLRLSLVFSLVGGSTASMERCRASVHRGGAASGGSHSESFKPALIGECLLAQGPVHIRPRHHGNERAVRHVRLVAEGLDQLLVRCGDSSGCEYITQVSLGECDVDSAGVDAKRVSNGVAHIEPASRKWTDEGLQVGVEDRSAASITPAGYPEIRHTVLSKGRRVRGGDANVLNEHIGSLYVRARDLVQHVFYDTDGNYVLLLHISLGLVGAVSGEVGSLGANCVRLIDFSLFALTVGTVGNERRREN